MLQRLNERVSNLEINYINQAETMSNKKVKLSFGKEDNTFMNNNNKRVKEFQQICNKYIKKEHIPDTQSHIFSPIEVESEANKIVDTEQFVYESSTILRTSPSSPKP